MIQLLIASLITGSIAALVGLSFSLVYRVTKFFNLSHGVIATIGGYTTFFLMKSTHFGIVSSIGFGIIVAGVVGYFLDFFIFRKLRARKASATVMLVASLGIMTAMEAILAMLFSGKYQSLSFGTSLQIFHAAGGVVSEVQIAIFLVLAAVIIGLFITLKWTRLGKILRAVSDESSVAQLLGIRTDRMIGYAVFVSSCIAGASGILIGIDSGLEPTLGLSLLLPGLIAVLIGGVNNLFGILFSAFAFAFMETLITWNLSGEWREAIPFVFLLIILWITSSTSRSSSSS